MAKWKCKRCGAVQNFTPANMQHNCGGSWKKQQEKQEESNTLSSTEATVLGILADAVFSNDSSSSRDSSPSSDPSPDFSGGGGDFGGGGASGEW